MFRMLEWLFYDVLKMKHYPDKPCPHMKGRLSELSDDTAKGLSRWYTQLHVGGCPGCMSTLTGLRRLRSRLLRLDEPNPNTAREPEDALKLSADRWIAITQSWEKTDEAVAESGRKGGNQQS
jgi:hypothetical protein